MFFGILRDVVSELISEARTHASMNRRMMATWSAPFMGAGLRRLTTPKAQRLRKAARWLWAQAAGRGVATSVVVREFSFI